MNSLESIFGELGISQYLDVFVDQGFDSWDTILDITESDLDALGVKLGHRRKLQRRIANSRGLAPDASLVSPARASIEDTKLDVNRVEGRSDSKDGQTAVKRKYRRHPKPDENAPERPPSAYVLFSNKMREELKGQNLTFTEIAKLVGENWQNLTRAEKEPFEGQAHEAKEKYNCDMSDYRKTADYRKYNDYLHEFRKRQAVQLQEKDASKRLRIDSDGIRGSSTSGTSSALSGGTSGTGSSSESQHGSEPPPTRQQRLGSEPEFSSTTDPRRSGKASHSSMASYFDEASNSRSRGLSSPTSCDSSARPSGRPTGWIDGQRTSGESSTGGQSWLDARAASGMVSNSPESSIPSLPSSQNRGNLSSGRHSTSSASTTISGSPSLRNERSSGGSSASSTVSRRPSDAPLPIHALLSSKSELPSYISPLSTLHTNPSIHQGSPAFYGSHPAHTMSDHAFANSRYHSSAFPPGPSCSTYPGQASAMAIDSIYGTPLEPRVSLAPQTDSSIEAGLDGISALLKAREIVDRQG